MGENENQEEKPRVIVYSTPTCPACISAKAFLDSKEIQYENRDVSTDPEARQEMVQESGQMGVPVLEISGKIIVGFNQGEIEAALGGA